MRFAEVRSPGNRQLGCPRSHAAYALADEARRGHLAPGTLGDVTILSGDVTAATPDAIRAMTVIATIVGGIAAYCADRKICSQLGG